MNSFMNCFTYNSPVGKMCIQDDGTAVTAVFMSDRECSAEPSPLAEKACAQLDEYFRGERKRFTIPVKPCGTAFQQDVWRKIQRIGYGKTVSYKDISESMGKPGACRAVGNACGKNPVLIIIPCHRVIGAIGNLTGYAVGTEIKKYLLDFENNHKMDLPR